MDINIIKNYSSFIADIFTIIVATYGIIFGILRKTKTVTGFKINYYVSRIFKTGIILFVFGIIFQFTKDAMFSIEGGSSILQLLSLIFIVTLGIFLFWLIAPIIWTSSFVYAVEFMNLFFPKSCKIDTKKFRNEIIFRIDKAIYGKDKDVFDVTDKLQEMVKNNSLRITASNAIAGDPFYGTKKDLIIDYTINGIAKRETIREGDTKIIPN